MRSYETFYLWSQGQQPRQGNFLFPKFKMIINQSILAADTTSMNNGLQGMPLVSPWSLKGQSDLGLLPRSFLAKRLYDVAYRGLFGTFLTFKAWDGIGPHDQEKPKLLLIAPLNS